MEHSFENSLPGRCRLVYRPAHRHIDERITGRPWLPLIELEVGHAGLGCTSYAKPGMDIALPPVLASHYTDAK